MALRKEPSKSIPSDPQIEIEIDKYYGFDIHNRHSYNVKCFKCNRPTKYIELRDKAIVHKHLIRRCSHCEFYFAVCISDHHKEHDNVIHTHVKRVIKYTCLFHRNAVDKILSELKAWGVDKSSIIVKNGDREFKMTFDNDLYFLPYPKGGVYPYNIKFDNCHIDP